MRYQGLSSEQKVMLFILHLPLLINTQHFSPSSGCQNHDFSVSHMLPCPQQMSGWEENEVRVCIFPTHLAVAGRAMGPIGRPSSTLKALVGYISLPLQVRDGNHFWLLEFLKLLLLSLVLYHPHNSTYSPFCKLAQLPLLCVWQGSWLMK